MATGCATHHPKMSLVQFCEHAALLLVMLTTAQAACPGNPWKEWDGHCYRLSASPVHWESLRAECKSPFRRADVASITSQEEQDFILQQFGDEQEQVWLGMRLGNENFWWVDGAPVTFTGFPEAGPTMQYHATMFDAAFMFLPNGTWMTDSSRDTKRRGVCKMKSCQCPRDWRQWGNRCYNAVKRNIGWLEARQQCRGMATAADLVTIRSKKENDFVGTLVPNKDRYWIGLNDREEEGMFRWSAGDRFTYTNWLPKEPNGYGHKEDCAVIRARDKKWTDTGCRTTCLLEGFICQQLMCGRDKAIPKETVGDGEKLRVWRPEDGVRCLDGWSRSGDSCFKSSKAAGTFKQIQYECMGQHPQGRVALIESMEDNDRAFYAADPAILPVWVDYDGRSSSAEGANFTYWIHKVNRECAMIPRSRSSGWGSAGCDDMYVEIYGICEVPACTPECPLGWALFEGHCYHVLSAESTLAEAKVACEAKAPGGTLASIQSQEENDFITTLAFPSRLANNFNKYRKGVYIGAERDNGDAAWSWTNSCDDWKFFRWVKTDGDEPPVAGSTCATIHPTGRWRGHRNCQTNKCRAVCKMDPCKEQFHPLDTSGCTSQPP